MDRGYPYCDPNYYGLGMYEVDMRPDREQNIAAVAGGAAASGHFEGNLGLLDVKSNQGGADPYRSLGPYGDGGHCEPGLQPQSLGNEELAVGFPQPRRTRPRIQYKFSQWQVQELEGVFQETQYPDVLTRRELARRVYVAETKVQAWFKYRRAKHRKIMKETMLKNAPPPAQDNNDAIMEGP